MVNNAGGAFGVDRVEDADLDQWRQMYELNVLGTLRVTKGVLPPPPLPPPLPLLRAVAERSWGAEGAGADVVVVTSTAAHGAYEGSSARHLTWCLGRGSPVGRCALVSRYE